MKRYIYIVLFLFPFLSCDKEGAWDCIQTAGNIEITEIDVGPFGRILVNRDVELVIIDGPEQKVEVETGENLLNDIDVSVVGDQLQLTNNNSCNYLRDYGITKIYVTTPSLEEVRNSSQFEVSSQGTLTFDNLVLTSEDFNVEDSFNLGDFRLDLNSNSVEIISNGLSTYYLSGNVGNLTVGFFAGNGRFEGADCIAENITVFHRGTNDMIVNPQLSLNGQLRSTGNLISMNVPSDVDVEQYYTGELIFGN